MFIMTKAILITVLVTGAAFAITYFGSAGGNDNLKKTTSRIGSKKGTQIATFGAGCFWGVEADFRMIKGVTATRVGYAGGTKDNPTYKEVCSDNTGHAEVVEVEFDPNEVTYDQLLQVFWDNHNPTTLNSQGPDHGEQYRSVIFYANEMQKQAAIKSKEALAKSGKWKNPIVTYIEPAKKFWAAEEYHQQYLEKRGMSSCHTK
jgi:peptide-methionine (S)-S-oxide reductase